MGFFGFEWSCLSRRRQDAFGGQGAQDEKEQHSYIQSAKEKGYEILLLGDHLPDCDFNHFLNRDWRLDSLPRISL